MKNIAPIQRRGLKQIGIRFSDNDFNCTVMSFMNLLLPDVNTHGAVTPCHKGPDAPMTVTFTKAQIVKLFNKLAHGLYLMKQNGWTYQDSGNLDTYLQIEEKHVFFDEEVARHIEAREGWDNGEFFCVDFATRYVWAV